VWPDIATPQQFLAWRQSLLFEAIRFMIFEEFFFMLNYARKLSYRHYIKIAVWRHTFQIKMMCF